MHHFSEKIRFDQGFENPQQARGAAATPGDTGSGEDERPAGGASCLCCCAHMRAVLYTAPVLPLLLPGRPAAQALSERSAQTAEGQTHGALHHSPDTLRAARPRGPGEYVDAASDMPEPKPGERHACGGLEGRAAVVCWGQRFGGIRPALACPGGTCPARAAVAEAAAVGEDVLPGSKQGTIPGQASCCYPAAAHPSLKHSSPARILPGVCLDAAQGRGFHTSAWAAQPAGEEQAPGIDPNVQYTPREQPVRQPSH